MNKVRTICATSAALTLLALVGCQRTPETAKAAVGGTAMTVDTVAAEIARIRCEHEASCSGVGPGRPYPSGEACMADYIQSSRTDLTVCSTGIDPAQFGSCLGLLRRETCHPLSVLSRMYSCRPSALCVRSETPSFTASDVYN
jgi:hypothetical protein